MTRAIRFTFLLLALTVRAQAQTETRPGVTVYPPAYFQANQPGTALDMVALLPGFQLQEPDTSLRGFAGAVGNVLIDGALPASKEESDQTLLQRIPVTAVDHIELIRAGASGIDLHGNAVMANIVRARAVSLRGRVEIEDAFSHFGLTAPRAALHLTRQGEDDTLDLSATYGREWNGNHGFGRRDRFAADGAVLQLATFDDPELKNFAEISAGYRRVLWGGELRLNTVLQQQVEYSSIAQDVTFPAPQASTEKDHTLSRALEAQLQFDHALASLGRWQIFASHRSDERDGYSFSVDNSGTALSQSRRDTGESILRGDVEIDRGMLVLEAGAEGAINIQDTKSLLAKDGTPLPLPLANVRVEEKRAEFFLTGSWRIDPRFTLEGGLRYEISTIGQRGDTNLSRGLSFLKPRLLATWRVRPDDELRLLAERRVGQLDFGGFVSSASLLNDTLSAGNRDLMPDRTFALQLSWEHRFWDRGSLTVTVRHEAIAGLLDHLPVTVNGQVFDATGNIGSGRRDQLQVALILPLERLSLQGLMLQADITLEHSRTRDPVTGAIRRFSGSEPLMGSIGLTHDLPQHHLRWGITFIPATRETDYLIDEIDARHHVSHLNAFVEYKPSPAWTIRLFGQDLAQPAYVRDRLIHDGLRAMAPLDHEERWSLNNGALLGLNLRFDFAN